MRSVKHGNGNLNTILKPFFFRTLHPVKEKTKKRKKRRRKWRRKKRRRRRRKRRMT